MRTALPAVLLLMACALAAPEPAFTREQAAVFSLALQEAAPASLGALSERATRRQLTRELRALRRMLPRASAHDVVAQLAIVRELLSTTPRDALTRTLNEIERAAARTLDVAPLSSPTTGEVP